MANEPFGGVLHPVFQHPVLFMYRNPRDILVSESHYYRNPRNTALGYYYQGMSQEECLISLLSKGGAIDCFADRMASYLPWFRLGNVIPVSYEELVGSKGGGSDSERLATIWSLQLKLGIEGRPADFAGLLNNSSDISRTFRKGSIGQHQDVFSANVWAEIEKQESDYMPGFGYSLGREADMPYPLYMANYRSRGLMLETPAREELPAEPVVVDTYEEWNIIEFRGVFYGLALSAGHVDFFDNDRLTTLALTGDLIECSGYPDVVDVLRQKKSKLELDMVVKYMNDVERRVAMLERGGQHNQDHPFISLLMPTRGRPDWVERFFRSVIEHTARIDRVEVILYVDDDDRGSHHLGNSEVRVVRIIGPRMSMGAYNSACLERAQGDIVILVNDDMVIKTHGWDEAVATMDASFSDGIYLAYGNDLFKGGRLCTFPIISRRTCEILIEPYPKEYRGAFIDYHLFDIFKRLQHAGYDRIRYLEDVVFEHLHFRAGKAEADETYAKRGRFDDDAIFLGLTALREQSAKRLLNVLQEKTTLVYEAVEVVQKDVPPKILQLLFYLTKNFLLDTKLPFKWRFFLWYWFVGRSFAARGLLGPFVKN